MNPVTSTGCTSVDIGDNANSELMDKFCYLGDMLSVDRAADAVVETRIRMDFFQDNPGEPVPEKHSPTHPHRGHQISLSGWKKIQEVGSIAYQ